MSEFLKRNSPCIPYNVNAQVQLAEDLSFFAVITEPSNGETKSTAVAHDIQALSQHLQQNDKDPAECELYASFQEKWTNGPKRATVMYCKDSDVIFVVPEDIIADTATSDMLTTLYRDVLYEIDQYVGSPKLCDQNVG